MQVASLPQINDLKDILLHSKKHKNTEFEVKVYPSRFRKILSDYYSLNAIEVPNALDNYAQFYNDYILSEIDETGNVYKIIKLKGDDEKRGRCEGCSCPKKRWINPDTEECYYKEMTTNNYTTKIQ